MKKINKFMSVLLVFIMVMSIIPISSITASAADATGICGENLSWTFDDSTGTLTISGTGAMDEYYVDDVEFVRPWEDYIDDIKSVIIENGVTSIGAIAFGEFVNLTNVTIADTVTAIGIGAFVKCTSLESITIPDSVTSMDDFVFMSCENLKNITMSNSITSFGNGVLEDTAFYNNESNWNNGVLYLGPVLVATDSEKVIGFCNVKSGTKIIVYGAFVNCELLTSVTIPNSVVAMGREVFRLCPHLTRISVDKDNKNFSSDLNGVLYNKDKTTLIKYPIGRLGINYTIPDSVILIEDSAFEDAQYLRSVKIGNRVTNIGNHAFAYCYNLTSIEIPDSVTTIDDFAFMADYSLSDITLSKNLTTIGDAAFGVCTNIKKIEIPSSVTSIGAIAFGGCAGLTDVYYSDTEEQWNKILIGADNDPLLNATIHFGSDAPNEPINPDKPEYNTFSIQQPSRTEIRYKDGIKLYANIDGNTYASAYVEWTANNNNFDTEELDGNILKIVAKNKGYTIFTATFYDADGNVLATDSVEMYSNSGFFQKIGGFFRGLFGLTKIYEN